jgi:hypothetical protein
VEKWECQAVVTSSSAGRIEDDQDKESSNYCRTMQIHNKSKREGAIAFQQQEADTRVLEGTNGNGQRLHTTYQ